MKTNLLIDLLKSYKDKSYIMCILCKQSYNHYWSVKNMIKVPLILFNTAMSVLNSAMFDPNDLKIPNKIVKFSTDIFIGLVYKVYEKINKFYW